MNRTFWLSSFLSFVGAMLIIVLIGAVLRHCVVPPPPKRFATSAFSFALPPGWSCGREGTEYVCREGAPPSDAIVILTMKLRDSHDTLAQYWLHLSSPIPAASKGKEASLDKTARLVSLRRHVIAGTTWVEAVLNGSEVPHYDTTYLAGHTAEIGILITLSVHEQARDRRADDLDQMMRTLVVNQRSN